MAARAKDVRAHGIWNDNPFGGGRVTGVTFPSIPRKYLAIFVVTGLLAGGWATRDYGLLQADEGIGYLLGIVSVMCMLTLLVYPLRKRFRFLKFIGPMPRWFRLHMILGVSAPITALYHCGFQLGSLNSRIALFSALIVAGSGLVGRFIYSKIHHGLYGRRASLKELLAQVKLTAPGQGVLGSFVPELMNRLASFDRKVLVPPKGLWDSFRLPLVLSIRTRLQYVRLVRFTRQSLAFQARRSTIVAEHQDQLERAICAFIASHLRCVRRVAEFTAYDRLFALWHKVHVPFFVSLVLSVVVHVIVVHVY